MRTWLAVMGGALVLAVAVTGAMYVVTGGHPGADPAVRLSAPVLGTVEPVAPAVLETGAPLRAADLRVSWEVLGRECWPGGCEVRGRVRLEHVDGPGSFTTPDTWLIKYRIEGGQDGAVLGSVELTEGRYAPDETWLNVRTAGTRVRVVVASVERVG